MSFPTDCPACARGDHANCEPNYGVRPGLIGGSCCGCTGDCAERFDAAELRLLDALHRT